MEKLLEDVLYQYRRWSASVATAYFLLEQGEQEKAKRLLKWLAYSSLDHVASDLVFPPPKETGEKKQG